MKPERWDEVDKILQSVLERAPAERRAYVDEVCADDSQLRREVLTVLGSYESAGSFMRTPAIESGDYEDAQNFKAGDAIGQYRVVRPIGRGGMGEVYLAEHTGQSRTVALKVLPAHFLDDAERVQRFRQEARAILALNHPNVVTVYDIGEASGVHFISTEFVEGETLRARLSRERLTLSESVEIASQIAGALAYAHERGVVHRDIKPENVMLRPDGYVKVLDFGIAKLTERGAEGAGDPNEARTRMKVETSPGMVMGTAHYMSPEQARGKKVDERTDTWSLGVVLYEMLTRRQPFDGETASDIIGVILQRDPAPLSALLPDAPAELERIISKALDKSADERYQTSKDFLADLRRFKRRHEHESEIERSLPPGEGTRLSAQVSTGGRQADGTAASESNTAAGAGHTTSSAEYIVTEFKRHRAGVLVALAAFVVVAAGLAAYKFWNRGGAGQGAEGGTHAPKLTTLPVNGNVTDGVISPDGKYVVYRISDLQALAESLWVRHLPTNTTVQILPPKKGSLDGLSFSADSNYIYYAYGESATESLSFNKISVLGGAPITLIDNARPASFVHSSDGKQLAFIHTEPNGGQKLLVANEDGTGERVLVTRNNATEWFASYLPAWSPDGKTIAFISGSSVGGYHCSPLLVNVSDGAQRPLGTTRWVWATDIVWLGDGSGLLASVGDSSTAPRQVWYVPYPDGEARKVTSDLNDYQVRGVTADSKTLLAVQTNTYKDVWVGPVGGDASQLKQVTFTRQDEVRIGAWTPDGKIIFSSVAGTTSQNLCVMNADGGDRRQITTGDGYDYNPALSPDGRVVFFTSMRNGGTPHIWRVDMNGSNLRQLTSGAFDDTNPHVTPDGKWVLFNSFRGGKLSAWKMAVDGGEPVQLSKSLAVRAISPDGKLMACYDINQQPGREKVFILPIEGGEPLKVLELPEHSSWLNFAWSTDGRAITLLRYANGTANIWALPVDGGPAKQLTHFNDPSMHNFNFYDLSRDGKQLAVTRTTRNPSLVLVTDFK
jgi:serine/threonine protein kinase/Tol biopolymer transport system component